MSDKMREEFEEWLRPYAQAKGYGYMDVLVRIDTNTGDYSTAWVDSAWIGWQASRAALVVELPAENDNGYITWTSAMRAIHAAGVKTK